MFVRITCKPIRRDKRKKRKVEKEIERRAGGPGEVPTTSDRKMHCYVSVAGRYISVCRPYRWPINRSSSTLLRVVSHNRCCWINKEYFSLARLRARLLFLPSFFSPFLFRSCLFSLRARSISLSLSLTHLSSPSSSLIVYRFSRSRLVLRLIGAYAASVEH